MARERFIIAAFLCALAAVASEPITCDSPHVNPNTQTREFSLRDPDGYYVTISALSAPQPAKRRPNKAQPTSRARRARSKSKKPSRATRG